MIANTHFAVVDVETTGVFPKGTDRIIEIAVVRVDSKGNILDEYATLINPHRDIPGSQVHGITARDVKNAPLFGEIAGDVLSLLAEAVFVAHNVSFDRRFVQAELTRVGCEVPDFPCLCTMQLARRVDPNIPSRRLGELCKYFGIKLDHPHSAYEDARATALLLGTCLSTLATESDLSPSLLGINDQPVAKDCWPQIPVSREPYPRRKAAHDILSEPSYIGQLVSRLPATTHSQPEIEEYLALLDIVLEDRRVSAEEGEALSTLAQEFGMSRTQVIDAHRLYMRDLIQTALEDAVITESESKDLEEVRRLLSMSDVDYKTILDDVTKAYACGDLRRRVHVAERMHVKGKSVCFTGELSCRINGEIISRPLAEIIAIEKGIVVKNYVTKALDFLVAGDTDSMSTKAKKARKYGVRIIAEPVFWRMMGIQVE